MQVAINTDNLLRIMDYGVNNMRSLRASSLYPYFTSIPYIYEVEQLPITIHVSSKESVEKLSELVDKELVIKDSERDQFIEDVFRSMLETWSIIQRYYLRTGDKSEETSPNSEQTKAPAGQEDTPQTDSIKEEVKDVREDSAAVSEA